MNADEERAAKQAADALSRAEAADRLVQQLETVQEALWGIQKALRDDKGASPAMFPFIRNDLLTLLYRPHQHLEDARKLLVIQAYDERRQAQ